MKRKGKRCYEVKERKEGRSTNKKKMKGGVKRKGNEERKGKHGITRREIERGRRERGKRWMGRVGERGVGEEESRALCLARGGRNHALEGEEDVRGKEVWKEGEGKEDKMKVMEGKIAEDKGKVMQGEIEEDKGKEDRDM